MSLLCPNCNTSNIDEAKFCKNCGADIAEELKKRYEKEEVEQQNIKQEKKIQEEKLKAQEEADINFYNEAIKPDEIIKNKGIGPIGAGLIAGFLVLGFLGLDEFYTNQSAEQAKAELEVLEKVYNTGEHNATKTKELFDLEQKDGIYYEKGTNVKANGISKLYYDGALLYETNYKDGKENGISKRYYESGKPMWEYNFKDGIKNGITKGYYESGALEYETNYKDGKENGISKSYYESGALASDLNITDGKYGIGKEYYESGSLKSEVTINDKLNGIRKDYYESGALFFEVTAKDGKAITGTLYKENGKKDRKMTNADFTKFHLEY